MTENLTLDNYLDALLAPVIELLKSEEPVVDSGNSNFFIDLGCDASKGDGQLLDSAAEMLRPFFDEIPEPVKNWLWWRTPNGLTESCYCEETLTSYPPDWTDVLQSFDKTSEEVFDVLNARMLRLAEQAYEDYEGADDEEESWEDDGEMDPY